MSEDKIRLTNIPEKWASTKLECCVNILDRKRVPINSKEREARISGKNKSQLYPYYGATGQVGWIDDYIFTEPLLLLGEDGAPFFDYTKNVAYVISGKTWVNNHAHVLKAILGVTTNSFLCYYLNQFGFQSYVTGTTRYKLNQSSMKAIPIPLPPLPEQHRIVAKIEELFTQLDAGVAALTTALAQLKRYRQSVLKAAFEGKLTEEWRERHAAIDLASDYINTQINNDFKSKNKEKSELSQIKNLPKSWIWTIVSSIGDVSGGLTKNSKRKSSDMQLPYLRVANVYQNKLDLHDIKNIGVHEDEIDKYRLKKGDLLVVEGNGSIDQIGRVALWDDSIPLCLHQNHIIKVRFDPPGIGRYVLYWLLSIEGRENIVRVASSTSGLHTLSISKVSSLPVPFPPYDEQNEIVAEIERRFTIIDETEKTIQQSLTQAEHLRQSILKRAFEGKLVPQDPDDEPASLLLERIKKEKAALKTAAKAKKKTKRSGKSKTTQQELI